MRYFLFLLIYYKKLILGNWVDKTYYHNLNVKLIVYLFLIFVTIYKLHVIIKL